MSHRIGVCSSCDANYKVPAEFAADKAKCKQCGGVVEVGPVVEDPPPPPVPAKTVRKAEPKMEEHIPSGKSGDGPSMLERLKAERSAKSEGATAPSTMEKLKAERRAQSAAQPPKAKVSARRGAGAGSRRAAKRGSSRRRGGGDEENEEGEEATGRRTRKKKKSLVPIICTLLLIGVLGVAAVGYWLMGAVEEVMEIAQAEQDKVIEAQITEAPEDAFEAPPEEEIVEIKEEAPVKKPKPVSAPKVKDPMEIDLASLADFGAPSGCSEAHWAKLVEDAALLVDPQAGAEGGRAGRRLQEAGRVAIPAIINVFKTRDLGSDEGFRDGDLLQRTLEKIYNGKNFGWKYTTEPNDHWYNRRVVELWWKNWDKFQGDEAGWLRFTGLDKEGHTPSGGGEAGLSTDELDALDDI